MKLFPTHFVKEHDGFKGVVAYRFMFRVKDDKDIHVAFRVGSPRDIQSFADMLAQDDNVVSAVVEYQYSIDMAFFSKVTPIKSLQDIAEEDV